MRFFLSFIALTSTLFGTITPIRDDNTLKIKSPTFAKRVTEKFQLENGMKVLLISDPNIERSAAAVSVQVGSYHDPKEYPGTAHFTEHLLFLGNEKYPKEDAFMKYCQEHGGMINAYTAPDQTVYMFTVNNNSFETALDQFGHMFVSPLFNANGIERELNAVDQENDKNIENDGWRSYMVLKELSNPSHPISRFSTGNKETIGRIPRNRVVEWHSTYYGSDRMHLVVYTSKSASEIKPQIDALFSQIKPAKKSAEVPSHPMFTQEMKGTRVYVKPIMDFKRLSLTWELPEAFARDMDWKTADLVSYILTSKGPNSLYQILKNENLVNDIHASADSMSTTCGLFSIDINLTEQGTQHIDVIYDRIFGTLNSLKNSNIPPYIFSEIRRMRQIDYEFQSKQHPFTVVQQAAHNMTVEGITTYPEKTLVPTTYDPKRVQTFLSLLTPHECLFSESMPEQFARTKPDRKEHWYGVEYTVTPIPTTQLEAWSKATPHTDFALTKQNPYLPKKLHLVSREEAPQSPQLIADQPYGKLYFKQDKEFLTPTVSWNIRVKTPLLEQTPESEVLAHIYSFSTADQNAGTTFFAQVAGLTIGAGGDSKGMVIALSGYSEKAQSLLRTYLSSLRKQRTTPTDFENIKARLKDYYGNQLKVLPAYAAMGTLESVLKTDSFTPKQLLTALNSISYEDFRAFETHLFDETYYEAIGTGNMRNEDALQVWSVVTETLGKKPFPEANHIKTSLLALPTISGPFKIARTSAMQGNVAILHMQMGDYTPERWALHTLLGNTVNPDFFEELRTKQQTGYITFGSASESEGKLIQTFLVQSTTHQSDELLSRFELFIEGYTKEFESKISRERFEATRSALLTSLQTPDTNLNTHLGRLQTEAFTFNGDFALTQKRLDAVQSITYEQLKSFCQEKYGRDNRKRLAVLITGAEATGKGFAYTQTDETSLKQEGKYVSWNCE